MGQIPHSTECILVIIIFYGCEFYSNELDYQIKALKWQIENILIIT